MFEFEKTYKTFIFFVKFRFELKQKILNIDNVSNIRINILNVVIMQKKIWNVNAKTTTIQISIKIETIKNLKISKTINFNKTIKISNSNFVKSINLNKSYSRERLTNVFENLITTNFFSKLNVTIATRKNILNSIILN